MYWGLSECLSARLHLVQAVSHVCWGEKFQPRGVAARGVVPSFALVPSSSVAQKKPLLGGFARYLGAR